MKGILVVFDFDGPLGNTIDAINKSYVDYYRVFRQQEITLEQAKVITEEHFAQKRKHKSEVRESDHEKEHKERLMFSELILSHQPELHHDLLERLEYHQKYSGDRYAIVSSGNNFYLSKLLSNHLHLFEPVLGFEDHYNKVEKVETVCTSWGCDYGDIVFVSDTLNDWYELENTLKPTNFLAITWGVHGEEFWNGVVPSEQIFHTFDQLLAELQRRRELHD